MSMTSSMCVSMTGRPTFAQRQNEQRRQSYDYYQVAKATTGLFTKQRECSVCPYWKDTETESGCSAPYSCSVIGR